MGGDEDAAALGCQGADGVAHPADAFGVEAVDRLIEDEVLRVAEEGGGESESLLHAERVAADLLLRGVGEADDLEAFLDAGVRDAGAPGEDAEVGAAATGRSEPGRVEEGAGGTGLVGEGGEVGSIEGDGAGGRPVETEDATHGGRLTGAVWAEEAGDGRVGDSE